MKTVQVLGTPLQITNHDEWIAQCRRFASQPGTVAIDFTNTQIVTMRRTDPVFNKTTQSMDHFVPDSVPLKWVLNVLGAQMKDRLYGPDFLRRCIAASPAPTTHYFLGGSKECLDRLRQRFAVIQPNLRALGWQDGYFAPDASPEIVEEINRLSPDFIWIGLGTPKQQEWIHRWKSQIHRGVLLAVGFAFDANAGTKKDSPSWMQHAGLGWLYRLLSEPRRLGARYIKYNSLFVALLLVACVRRENFQKQNKLR